MLLFKDRCHKQAIDPGYSFLVSEHTVIIFRNQIFHSGFHLSLKFPRNSSSISSRTESDALSTPISIFLIKFTFVSVCPEQQSFGPRRCTSHLLTDGIDTGIPAAFDDQFIMDMTDDGTAPQGLHGIAEDIPADALDDVFHELRAVALQPVPTFSLRRCLHR